MFDNLDLLAHIDDYALFDDKSVNWIVVDRRAQSITTQSVTIDICAKMHFLRSAHMMWDYLQDCY